MADEMEKFLRSIDPGIIKYRNEFLKHDVSSEATMRYLRPVEVESMNMPGVYKRMLVDKILNLQTPETKTKMKSVIRQAEHGPKQLRFEKHASDVGDSPDRASSNVISSEVQRTGTRVTQGDSFLKSEQDRLDDERDTLSILLLHKKDSLKEMKAKPNELEPLNIPGNPMTKFICDNCHHRGHHASQNRGNKSCPFLPCPGYHVCGLEVTKHCEYKHALTEVTKEIGALEKRMKCIDEEISSIKTFLKHNSTNFITALRPVLKGHFPSKYIGHQGSQLLQRDMRMLKIACSGKLPDDLSKNNIEKLIDAGRGKVTDVCADVQVVDGQSGASSPTNSTTPDHCQSPWPLTPNSGSVSTSLNHVSPYLQMSPNWGLSMQQQWGNNAGVNPYMYAWQGDVNHSMMYSAPYGQMWGIPATNTYSVPVQSKACTTTKSSDDIYPPLPSEDPPSNPPLPEGDD